MSTRYGAVLVHERAVCDSCLLPFQDFKALELSCETQDEVDSWKASFLRAGVYPEKASEAQNGDENNDTGMQSLDPQVRLY